MIQTVTQGSPKVLRGLLMSLSNSVNEEDLLRIRNVGVKTFNEINLKVEVIG